MECTRCGGHNEPGANYCSGCGVEFEPKVSRTVGRRTLGGNRYSPASLPGPVPSPLSSSGDEAAARPLPQGDDEGAAEPASRPTPLPGPLGAEEAGADGSGEPGDALADPEGVGESIDEYSQQGERAGQASGVSPGPSDDAPARLSVVRQDGSIGDIHRLESASVDIGRALVGIQLATDRFVSPRHARVTREASDYYLSDLESVNGVFLRLRSESLLRHGDRVLLGSEWLKFEQLEATELGEARSSREDTDIYGSTARPWYARLTQHTVEGVARNTYILFAEETVVGRETGDIVFTSDSFMSRRHALFRRDSSAGGFTLRDLGSSNGTYLGIRGRVLLQQGDHIRVGQHLFRFGLGS